MGIAPVEGEGSAGNVGNVGLAVITWSARLGEEVIDEWVSCRVEECCEVVAWIPSDRGSAGLAVLVVVVTVAAAISWARSCTSRSGSGVRSSCKQSACRLPGSKSAGPGSSCCCCCLPFSSDLTVSSN